MLKKFFIILFLLAVSAVCGQGKTMALAAGTGSSFCQGFAGQETDFDGQKTGWQEIGGEKYYFSPESGELQTGWQEIGGKRYYFLPESGEMQTGWQKVKGKAYFLNKNGVLQTSRWIKTNGKTYYAGQKGVLSSGWLKNQGKTYYFSPKNNQMQTGWKKIKGLRYFFAVSGKEKGALQKNCIAGTKKTGYYYVDGGGVRTTSGEIKAAVDYVIRHTKKSWSRSKKLESCFLALRQAYSYRHFDGVPKGKDLSGYAKYLLTNGRGNCYRYASGFACIAKVLGYEARVHVGEVTSIHGGMAAHGWATVKSGGKWYICDVGMRLFLKTKSPTRKYVPFAIYKLNVEKGSVAWRKV